MIMKNNDDDDDDDDNSLSPLHNRLKKTTKIRNIIVRYLRLIQIRSTHYYYFLYYIYLSEGKRL